VTLLTPVPLFLGGESNAFREYALSSCDGGKISCVILLYRLYTKETIGQVLGRRPLLH